MLGANNKPFERFILPRIEAVKCDLYEKMMSICSLLDDYMARYYYLEYVLPQKRGKNQPKRESRFTRLSYFQQVKKKVILSFGHFGVVLVRRSCGGSRGGSVWEKNKTPALGPRSHSITMNIALFAVRTRLELATPSVTG